MKSHKRLSPLNDTVPYAQLVGIELWQDDQGLLCCLNENPDNIGNEIIGAIHGGVIGGFLEHAASFHLLEELGEGANPAKIVNLSIDYLRPALAKNTYARGVVIKQGKRIANVRVHAWQEDENRPVACAHAHFLIA